MDALFGGPIGPLIILALRCTNITLTTIRTVLAVRGRKLAGASVGFIETVAWVFAAGGVLEHLTSPLHVVGYATGFSLGTVLGVWLEEKLAFGHARMQIVSRHGGVEIAEALRRSGFGATEILGQGRDGRVEIVQVVTPRRRLRDAEDQIRAWDPDAFVTVEEPRTIQRGWMP